MLAIAVALARRPAVLLLDEPSQGLAPMVLDHLVELIGGLRKLGLTVVLAEQNHLFAARLADRYLVLQGGEIAGGGSGAELYDRDRLLADVAAQITVDSESEALGTLLTRLAASGMAVLLVEHDMELVMRICDTIHVLDFGEVIASGSPDEVRADPAVQAAYLGAGATPGSAGGPGPDRADQEGSGS